MTKFYITTSIPYANGQPHIGHALEFVCSDVLARLAVLRGDQLRFSSGMDEHGEKIATKAEEYGLSPKEFTDTIAQKFIKLQTDLDITTTIFTRTTDAKHQENVQKIWTLLAKDIYKAKYEGWYCVGDEAFYTETEVKANNGICPNHQTPYQRVEEDNYFFKLSKYSSSIKKAIETDQFLIVPTTRKNEILSLINSGLEDISISRPKSKVPWGISLPHDNQQTMYVWFEALLNYLTNLNYPQQTDLLTDWWPVDVQVIGKDILRFHAAIWPGLLLALNLDLPKTLYVHGFITSAGQKMSKTLGNVIDPIDLINQFGSDALRYYLLRHIPSYDDGDLTLEKFKQVYNSQLANELGNLNMRIFAMINKYLKPLDLENIDLATEHDDHAYYEALANYRFDLALEEVWVKIRALNQYIEEEKPWQLASNDPVHLKEVLIYLLSALQQIANLLVPFLPKTANLILKQLAQPFEETNQVIFTKVD